MSVTPPSPPAIQNPKSKIQNAEVLDLLTGLVQKSLVVYDEDEQGRGRYRLLETVRQYSRDRLLESGETEAVRGRHLSFFVELGERAEPHLRGREQLPWLDRPETALADSPRPLASSSLQLLCAVAGAARSLL